MVARRSRPKPVTEIPAGWPPHDGSGRPVPRKTRPAILFRMGTTIRMGARDAGDLEDWREDPWTWSPRSKASMDIVAYKPEEDEFIAIPRLDS